MELVTDEKVKGQGLFVWPDEPKDWSGFMRDQIRDETERQKKEGKQLEGVSLGRAWDKEEQMQKVADRAEELLKKAGRASSGSGLGW